MSATHCISVPYLHLIWHHAIALHHATSHHAHHMLLSEGILQADQLF